VVEEIDYDEFGTVTNDTSPGLTPFGFAGGLYDKDTGLVRFGARDYDASVGRWTSKDPIRFDGGLFNLYGYVINDPVNRFDPHGTDPWYSGGICALLPFLCGDPGPGEPPPDPLPPGGAPICEEPPPPPAPSGPMACGWPCDTKEGQESCNRCCEFQAPDSSSKCKADCCQSYR
jgi:RHS repeat-associated protein